MPNLPESMELFRRASKVIPGGIYGHASPAAGLPGAFPYYAEKQMGVGTGMWMAANIWTSCVVTELSA